MSRKPTASPFRVPIKHIEFQLSSKKNPSLTLTSKLKRRYRKNISSLTANNSLNGSITENFQLLITGYKALSNNPSTANPNKYRIPNGKIMANHPNEEFLTGTTKTQHIVHSVFKDIPLKLHLKTRTSSMISKQFDNLLVPAKHKQILVFKTRIPTISF